MPINENGFVNKLVQQEALVIKKKQFDAEYLTTARTNAIMFNKNCIFYSIIIPVFHPGEPRWAIRCRLAPLIPIKWFIPNSIRRILITKIRIPVLNMEYILPNPGPTDWKKPRPYDEDLAAKYLPSTLKF